MDIIKEVKELADKDSLFRFQLCSVLELIVIVDRNMSHISQLESLVAMFKLAKNGYGNLFNSFVHIVAENTRANHYRQDLEQFDDVYTIGKELFPANRHFIKTYEKA